MKPLLSPPMGLDQFLTRLHELIQPEVYLETGTEVGGTLALAQGAGMAIAVSRVADIMPVNRRDNQRVFTQTVDEYFGCESCERHPIDLAVIGSRLFDDALRDLVHVERFAKPNTVVVMPNVLPTSQDMAWRVRPPGDWTGDVFKIAAILSEYRPDLTLRLVDVAPTGALVVTGLDPRNVILEKQYDRIVADWLPRHLVPDAVLQRVGAITPEQALAAVAAELESVRKRGVRA
jgi:hypothetical protein